MIANVNVFECFFFLIFVSFLTAAGRHKMPIQWNTAPPYIREKYMDMFYEYRNASIGPESLHTTKMNIDEALKFVLGVNKNTCRK